MSQLLETIKVFQNTLQRLQYHSDRVNQSRWQLFGVSEKWDLSKMIAVPRLDPGTIYRCRFIYGVEPGKTEFIQYKAKEVRKLYAINCGNLDYSHKYADRSVFDSLRSHIPDPDIADILLIKGGLITDTSFANVVLTDGIMWYTPATPLLKGTKRQYYLDKGLIREKKIKFSELHQYKEMRLINSMLDIEDNNGIPVESVFEL